MAECNAEKETGERVTWEDATQDYNLPPGFEMCNSCVFELFHIDYDVWTSGNYLKINF